VTDNERFAIKTQSVVVVAIVGEAGIDFTKSFAFDRYFFQRAPAVYDQKFAITRPIGSLEMAVFFHNYCFFARLHVKQNQRTFNLGGYLGMGKHRRKTRQDQ